jgi:hypothetical protein
MEDRSQGSGRNRPPSSNSAHTRMTPTSSSNSSSAHLPARTTQNNGTARGPSTSGASLLQERLRERKVESARQSRRRSIDLTSTEIGPQSSPTKAPSRPGTSATGKGMGVKQVEEVGYTGILLGNG